MPDVDWLIEDLIARDGIAILSGDAPGTQALYAITSRTGASDLFDIKETLSPEMARLLDAPTHDLWNGGTA